MSITHIHRGIMGTVEFDGLFPGMRKSQEFITYPMHASDPTDRATVQSDNRIGVICLATGAVAMSPPRPNGGNRDRGTWRPAGQLTGEELLALKAGIACTAGRSVGTSGVITTDNSGAALAFGSASC